MQKSILIVGPFATEYSLSKVNRALALALAKNNKETKVGVWGTEETIDRLPQAEEYRRYPFLKELFSNGKELAAKPEGADVVIYNNFPKNSSGKLDLSQLPGKIKLAFLAWEESIYPQRWVDECNKHLHGIMVTSVHVKNIFKRCGIQIPIAIIPEGLDIPFVPTESHPLKTRKGFKFLHISSGQYRKGVDVLLKAYFSEFSEKDDVCLILKLFPNASLAKDIGAIIATRPEQGPELEIINATEISDGYLKYLYEQSDSVVLPSRAEGYGLPMAEALQFGKPLITTGYSGHMDFCSEENSFLIDYQLVPSQSHLNVIGAKVAEPEQKSLQRIMRYIFENSDSQEVKSKIETGKLATAGLTWDNSAVAVKNFLNEIIKVAPLKKLKMAVFSTYNSKCGVATYSKDLYSGIISSFKEFKIFANSDIGDRTYEDEPFVQRVWQYAEMSMDKAQDALDKYKPDLIHIQHNLSFYAPIILGKLIRYCNSLNIPIYVTLHAYFPSFKEIIPELNLCEKVFVHSTNDIDLFKNIGLRNGILTNHGLNLYKDVPTEVLRKQVGFTIKDSPIIATHGLIHDKKGFSELIQACAILKKEFQNLVLLLITAVNPNNSTSAGVYKQMLDLVIKEKLEKNVIIMKDYLSYPEVIRLLQLSDLITLPYGEINEGTSGAITTCISASRPIIITNSHIFAGLKVGYRINDNKPETIAQNISALFKSKEEMAAQKKSIVNYAEQNTWEKIAGTYLLLLADDQSKTL